MSSVLTDLGALTPQHFRALEQPAFQSLEHAAYLKGLLKPFKGKGLEDWASRCEGLRDGLIDLAQQDILQQAKAYPFALLPIQLALQTTGAGTAFLRWRRVDRSAMGVSLWEELIGSTLTPSHLVSDLYAMEQQRITLNMQISLVHTMHRQSLECASKMQSAQTHYQRRASQGFATSRRGT